jgi:hypothetical protein
MQKAAKMAKAAKNTGCCLIGDFWVCYPGGDRALHLDGPEEE